MAKPSSKLTAKCNEVSAGKIPRQDLTLWVLASLVMIPALLPLVVGFLQTIYFDIDPRLLSAPIPVTAFGPAGLSVLHLLSIIIAGFALSATVLLGGRLHRFWIALAVAGVAASLWQMMQNTNNQMLTGAWIAGVCLGLAVVHLGQFASARRAMIALTAAIMIPIGLQASFDVLIQKPRDVAYWEANEAELLERDGVEPGSSQHELLDRRARSMDATGPFGFSNPLGSITAGGVCIGFGLAFGMRHARKKRRWMAIAPILAGGFALVAVWYTHSTGALGALFIAGLLVAAIAMIWRSRLRWLAPWLVVAALGGVVAIVLLRGAMGPPETMAGERSLLFRFHYWQAAMRMVGDHFPLNALLGVGPEGFTQGYLVHKNPLSPEDVLSAHSVTVDFLVMLGVGGVCWVVLLVGWLVAGGKGVINRSFDEIPNVASKLADAPRGPLLHRPGVVMAMGVAAVVFGTQYIVQLPMMSLDLVLVWLAGLLAFVCVASIIARPDFVIGKAAALGLLASGAAIFIHSQIEMAFVIPATIGPAFVFVALGATHHGKRIGSVSSKQKNCCVAGGCFAATVVLSLFLGIAYVQPTVSHQASLAKAQDALTYGRIKSAQAALSDARHIMPDDATAVRWTSIIYRDEYFSRAYDQPHGLGIAASALASAIHPLDQMIERGDAPAWVYRSKARLLWTGGEAFQDATSYRLAIASQLEAIARSPYNLSDHVALGDWYWQLGDYEKAEDSYEQAIQIDKDQYLDIARQLEDDERTRLTGLIQLSRQGRGTVPDSPPAD